MSFVAKRSEQIHNLRLRAERRVRVRCVSVVRVIEIAQPRASDSPQTRQHQVADLLSVIDTPEHRGVQV